MTETSLDVHGISAGEAQLTKTIVPVVAEANLSLRLWCPGKTLTESRTSSSRLFARRHPSEQSFRSKLLATAAAVTDPRPRR